MGCPPRVPGNAQILAKIIMLEFAQASDAETLLAMDFDERKKFKNFEETVDIIKIEHHAGNDCIRQ